MEQNKLLIKPFKQKFNITDIKHIIVGIPFITKLFHTINIINSKLQIKDKYTMMNNTSVTFFQSLNKQPPLFSNFHPKYNQERKELKPLSRFVCNFLMNKVHQYNFAQNRQRLYMSDFEFKPIY